uniref:hyaluronidase-2-like isoform X1 n=2 Tax=Myxine glutinosa TaxID=7769 RepID=UPI00358EA85D
MLRDITSSALIRWRPISALLYITFTTLGCQTESLHARSPLIPDRPFLVVWNIPSEQCEPRYRMKFDMSPFDLVCYPNEHFKGQSVTVFYHDRLGLYPHYKADGVPVNGGLPQNASLLRHLDKAKEDIESYMPLGSPGRLAVIDWEDWRPQWIRNWDKKDVYRLQSRQLVHKMHPDWHDELVNKQAQWEFETSARQYMLETLYLGTSLRPDALWGFYLFPDCYNHDYQNNFAGYTGHCPEIEILRNKELEWLWQESTALFPSIYMPRQLRSTTNGRKFVQHRVLEALRVAQLARRHHALPVFVYTQPVYIYAGAIESNFKTEIDLVHSIGESAALGAAGIILWGDMKYAQSRESCIGLKQYVANQLGTYITNVSKAARECSRAVCNQHGRCARRIPSSEGYLHLNPHSFTIWPPRHEGEGFLVSGRLSRADLRHLERNFVCHCYVGWDGERCDYLSAAMARTPLSFRWILTVGLITPIFYVL